MHRHRPYLIDDERDSIFAHCEIDCALADLVEGEDYVVTGFVGWNLSPRAEQARIDGLRRVWVGNDERRKRHSDDMKRKWAEGRMRKPIICSKQRSEQMKRVWAHRKAAKAANQL